MKRTPLPHGSKVGFCSLLAALLLLGSSTPALAADTGDLDLTGSVATVCDVVVTPVAGVADDLPLSGAQSGLVVGSVTETCNDPNGYSLSADSLNDSELVAVGSSTDTVPFAVTYGGAGVNLNGAAVTIVNTTGPTGPGGVTNDVAISYADPGFIQADTYTDTITFTITAK